MLQYAHFASLTSSCSLLSQSCKPSSTIKLGLLKDGSASGAVGSAEHTKQGHGAVMGKAWLVPCACFSHTNYCSSSTSSPRHTFVLCTHCKTVSAMAQLVHVVNLYHSLLFCVPCNKGTLLKVWRHHCTPEVSLTPAGRLAVAPCMLPCCMQASISSMLGAWKALSKMSAC